MTDKINKTKMSASNIDVMHPRPWHCEAIEVGGTKTCHHKTRSWVIVDANNRRVWWTERVVSELCAIANAAAENAAE